MTLWQDDSSLIYLKPGELYFSRGPAVVVTVLGSCVAVTMFNRRLGVAAICHAQLPGRNVEDDCSGDCPVICGAGAPRSEVFKYLDCSICYMNNKFSEMGILPGEIEVKVFGGADVLPVRSQARTKTVGAQNIEKAREMLACEGLVLSASSVGGSQGMKIFFYTETGRVLLKYVQKGQFAAAPELSGR